MLMRMANDLRGYWFTSPLFRVEPGEEAESNPGRYGRQLATWLAARLRDRGHDAGPATPEDWGWSVDCRKAPDRFVVACGSVDDGRAGAGQPATITWHCFVVAASPILRRLLARGGVARASQRLDDELRAILEGEPAIALTEEP